jgi:CHAT domain-containing protein
VEKKMRARIDELNGQRAALQKAIKTQFPAYAQLVRPEAIVLAEVARQLKPTQALVVLLPTENAVYVWALTDSGVPRFHRAELGLKRVNDLLKRVRRTLEFSDMKGSVDKFDAAAASDLYQSLLKPIEETFSNKEDLIISAGGPLAQIPFSVLLTEPDTDGSESQWLIKRHAVTHVPSISSWLALRRFARSKPADEAMLGWGDPLFDPASSRVAGGTATRNVALRRASRFVDLEHEAPQAIDYRQIPPLPETRDELLAIARVVHASPASDLKLGDQATRESVLAASRSGLMGRKRVIAFATHGLMAGDFPGLNEPALALAASGSEKSDPMAFLLTLQDVMGLKLNADWVLLSACNTAAADGKAEEALSGLARGFFYAGSRSVLVTHWAVESESAKQLTTATFEHYAANPQAPKSESLRQAMLKVMRQPEFAHPALWAPYALVGDGNR